MHLRRQQLRLLNRISHTHSNTTSKYHPSLSSSLPMLTYIKLSLFSSLSSSQPLDACTVMDKHQKIADTAMDTQRHHERNATEEESVPNNHWISNNCDDSDHSSSSSSDNIFIHRSRVRGTSESSAMPAEVAEYDSFETAPNINAMSEHKTSSESDLLHKNNSGDVDDINYHHRPHHQNTRDIIHANANADQHNVHNHIAAVIPDAYHTIHNALITAKRSRVAPSQMISFFSESIANKLENWSDCQNLVNHCFALHEAYTKHCNAGNCYQFISLQYISKLAHLLSNSSGNKTRMTALIRQLKHLNMHDMGVFQTLIESCYSDDTFGDPYLARHIFLHFTIYDAFIPNEATVRALLMTCVQRGYLDLSFTILQDLRNKSIPIETSAFRVVFDICVIKHSIECADKLLIFILRNGYALNVDILNQFLNVCWICGHWEKALEVIQLLHSKRIEPNLTSINLLLKAFATNAEIYQSIGHRTKDAARIYDAQRKGYFIPINTLLSIVQPNKRYTSFAHSVAISPPFKNGQPLKVVSNLMQKYGMLLAVDKHTAHERGSYSGDAYKRQNVSKEEYRRLLRRIFERLSFFASRFENDAKFQQTFYATQSFHRKFTANHQKGDGGVSLLGDPQIMYNFLHGSNRRSKRAAMSVSPMNIWITFQQHMNPNLMMNTDKHSNIYALMLNICTWKSSNVEYRSLGRRLCGQMKKCQYLAAQRVYDAVLNFHAANKDANEATLFSVDRLSDYEYGFTASTIMAWLRMAMQQNNQPLMYDMMAKIEAQPELLSSNPSLIKLMIRVYSHFGLYLDSLLLFQRCLLSNDECSSFQNNKYDVAFCLYHILQTYVSSCAFSECVQHFIYNFQSVSSSDPSASEHVIVHEHLHLNLFEYCWEQQYFVADHITFLVYCCYQTNDINAVLHLFERILQSYTLKNRRQISSSNEDLSDDYGEYNHALELDTEWDINTKTETETDIDNDNNNERQQETLEMEHGFDLEMDYNIVNVPCFNWCTELLVKLYGQFSPSVMQIVTQFIEDDIWFCNFAELESVFRAARHHHNSDDNNGDSVASVVDPALTKQNIVQIVISLSAMTASVVPIVIRLFVEKYNELLIAHQEQIALNADGIEVHFCVVCSNDYWHPRMKSGDSGWQSDSNQTKKRKQSTGYRLFFGEEASYLMSIAQYELTTKYQPSIHCQRQKNSDQLICKLPTARRISYIDAHESKD